MNNLNSEGTMGAGAGGMTLGDVTQATTESQRQRINGMMDEIEKNTAEIELLKQKL